MRISDWSSDVCSSDLPIKATTAEALKALHALGVMVAMVTGDNRRTAEAIARQLGIDEVVAEVLPDGKVEALHRLREGGRRSEEHTSELQSLMRISYAVFCLKKKKKEKRQTTPK